MIEQLEQLSQQLLAVKAELKGLEAKLPSLHQAALYVELAEREIDILLRSYASLSSLSSKAEVPASALE